jgi:hypothetical protein
MMTMDLLRRRYPCRKPGGMRQPLQSGVPEGLPSIPLRLRSAAGPSDLPRPRCPGNG